MSGRHLGGARSELINLQDVCKRGVCDVRVKAVPTVGAIQRTTIVVAVLAAAFLLIEASPVSAVSCILGAALMVANLFALSWIVQTMFALARQAGGATAAGLIVAPMKMLLLVGIVFLIVESGRVNIMSFVAGTLTQFVAIFIEVGCALFGTTSAPSY
jgi:small-conductance mechanosensitive channel